MARVAVVVWKEDVGISLDEMFAAESVERSFGQLDTDHGDYDSDFSYLD